MLDLELWKQERNQLDDLEVYYNQIIILLVIYNDNLKILKTMFGLLVSWFGTAGWVGVVASFVLLSLSVNSPTVPSYRDLYGGEYHTACSGCDDNAFGCSDRTAFIGPWVILHTRTTTVRYALDYHRARENH